MTTIFHTWPYGRFIEIQSNLRRKKLHRTNQGSNFFRGSFSHWDNLRVPIQFRRESQPQHLRRWFFHKNRLLFSSIFHFSSTSVIRPVKRNQMIFCSIEINKPFLVPVQCHIDQIQVQKPNFLLARIRCQITLSRE